jgi:hypothetical protein
MTDTTTATAPATEPAPAAAPTTPATPTEPQQQQPLTVEQARTRRNEIFASKELMKKLGEGNKDLREELTKLNKAISGVDLASAIQSQLNGINPENPFANTTTPGILGQHEYASAAEYWVPLVGRDGFEAGVTGRAVVSREKYNEAIMRKEIITSDPEWMRNYHAHSKAHRNQMSTINWVLKMCRVVD